jgi:hypothetical protein
MKKGKGTSIEVQGTSVSIISEKDTDYISLTDMLKAKDGEFFISDWLRNRNTVEFLGISESIYNPDFNYGEFATIRSQAGLNSYKISVKEWVEKTAAIGLKANPELTGNMRDHATIEQLLVLANLEGMNAELIHMGLPQGDRLKRLNEIAIRQMQTLTANPGARKLGPLEEGNE